MKQRKFTRIIALVVASVMLLAGLSVIAFAEDLEAGDYVVSLEFDGESLAETENVVALEGEFNVKINVAYNAEQPVHVGLVILSYDDAVFEFVPSPVSNGRIVDNNGTITIVLYDDSDEQDAFATTFATLNFKALDESCITETQSGDFYVASAKFTDSTHAMYEDAYAAKSCGDALTVTVQVEGSYEVSLKCETGALDWAEGTDSALAYHDSFSGTIASGIKGLMGYDTDTYSGYTLESATMGTTDIKDKVTFNAATGVVSIAAGVVEGNVEITITRTDLLTVEVNTEFINGYAEVIVTGGTCPGYNFNYLRGAGTEEDPYYLQDERMFYFVKEFGESTNVEGFVFLVEDAEGKLTAETARDYINAYKSDDPVTIPYDMTNIAQKDVNGHKGGNVIDISDLEAVVNAVRFVGSADGAADEINLNMDTYILADVTRDGQVTSDDINVILDYLNPAE